MKVSEMIELLQQMPQDLEVYSYCDHGQIPEESLRPHVVAVVKSEYENGTIDGYISSIQEAVDSDYEESDLVEIVLL